MFLIFSVRTTTTSPHPKSRNPSKSLTEISELFPSSPVVAPSRLLIGLLVCGSADLIKAKWVRSNSNFSGRLQRFQCRLLHIGKLSAHEASSHCFRVGGQEVVCGRPQRHPTNRPFRAPENQEACSRRPGKDLRGIGGVEGRRSSLGNRTIKYHQPTYPKSQKVL